MAPQIDTLQRYVKLRIVTVDTHCYASLAKAGIAASLEAQGWTYEEVEAHVAGRGRRQREEDGYLDALSANLGETRNE